MRSDPEAEPHSPARLISDLVVRLNREHAGLGPTEARTYLGDDVVTVLVTQAFTTGEQSLIDDGYQAQVLASRKALQDTMRDELVAGVEAILERTVSAFMSANKAAPDLAVMSFVLEPRG